MADPPNIKGATQCLDMMGVMSLLHSGRVHLGFLGAAEVDRFGNLNSTEVRSESKFTRLPGSGGACDIASLAHRFVALLEHSKRRLPERVSYVTSPGNGSGGSWRKDVGLPRGGPSAVITTKCVLRFGEDGEAYLASVHPGVTIDDVLANTGWRLRVAEDVIVTATPTEAELATVLRGRRAMVKALLMDQARIAGLGNRYSDEALFTALIRPDRPVNALSLDEIDTLHAAIIGTLQRAIDAGGGSQHPLHAGDRVTGGARGQCRVAGREGQPCLVCGHTLDVKRIGGRQSCFCPFCQT
jgi:glutaconate CoA-transferase subunit B